MKVQCQECQGVTDVETQAEHIVWCPKTAWRCWQRLELEPPRKPTPLEHAADVAARTRDART